MGFIRSSRSPHATPILFVCKQRWLASVVRQLLGTQQGDQERPLSSPPHLGPPGCSSKGLNLFENRPSTRLPLSPNCRRRWVQDCIQDSLWVLRMVGYAIRPYQCTCSFSKVYEWHSRWPIRSLHSRIHRWYTDLFGLTRTAPRTRPRNTTMPPKKWTLC